MLEGFVKGSGAVFRIYESCLLATIGFGEKFVGIRILSVLASFGQRRVHTSQYANEIASR
ncbi:hypothetical protein E2C01_090567 [Portunus trituberculatus]|uniref:Uncharacterized protein n=1 Tax=Portunus trituberculatus TaxID=210409 RepID=A0A5B7JF20_PORTR|nr:hypothetical protein [Portunus trituberculatus]